MKQGMHNSKFTAADCSGIEKEQKRENKEVPYRNEVDLERSHLNVIKGSAPWRPVIEKARKLTQENTGKKVRANTICFDSIIESVPHSWDRERVIDYFNRQDQMIRGLLRQQGMDDEAWSLSSIIHFDETNPHRTFTFVPFMDGKLQNKNIVNRYFLRQLVEQGWDVYQQFAEEYPDLEKLDPPDRGLDKDHLSELEYKIKQLEQEVDEYHTQYVQYKELCQDLQMTVAAKEEYIYDLKEKISRTEEIKGILDTDLQDYNDRISKASQELQKVEDNVADLKNEQLFLENSIEDLNENIDELLLERNSLVSLTIKAEKVLERELGGDIAPLIEKEKENQKYYGLLNRFFTFCQEFMDNFNQFFERFKQHELEKEKPKKKMLNQDIETWNISIDEYRQRRTEKDALNRPVKSKKKDGKEH